MKIMSRPLRARGLKRSTDCITHGLISSRPLRARGLKLLPSRAGCPWLRRALYGRVD